MSPRNAEPNLYMRASLVEKGKRGAEGEAAGKATYGGVFLNRYEESLGKEKRGPSDKSTYGGVFLNRYEESSEKD